MKTEEDITNDALADALEEIEQLKAERAKLREALEQIAEQKTSDELHADHVALLADEGVADYEAGYDQCVKMARAALA